MLQRFMILTLLTGFYTNSYAMRNSSSSSSSSRDASSYAMRNYNNSSSSSKDTSSYAMRNSSSSSSSSQEVTPQRDYKSKRQFNEISIDQTLDIEELMQEENADKYTLFKHD